MNRLKKARSGVSAAAEVVLIDAVAGFDALEAEWDALHREAGASVFQSFIWQRCWWRHHGENSKRRHLRLVTIRDGGGLMAVVPLYIDEQRHNALASTRTLRFIGNGTSDHLDMIVRPGMEQAAAHALAGYLASLWKLIDAMDLSEIPDESSLRKMLGDELAAVGMQVTVEIDDNCPRLTLADTWEETLVGASGDFRRKMRARTNRLMKHAVVGFEVIEDPAAFAAAMDDFVPMHQERHGNKAGGGLYSYDRNEGFHREVCAEMHGRGWLFLSFLTLDGQRVMGNCYYYLNNRVFCHVGGAREMGEVWNHSPGIVFESYCIQEALRRGARVYDFLRGTEPYKYRFGAVDVPNWRISIRRVRPSVRILKSLGTVLGRVRGCLAGHH